MTNQLASGLNDINDIPKAWRHALAAVQVTFPDAMLAGGCLRDRHFRKPVKDLDIFISTSTDGVYNKGALTTRLRAAGWADVQLNGDESYANGGPDRGIVAVVDMKYPGAPPIQLIAMKVFSLDEFDFGVCQIGFDGKRIIRTRAFHDDSRTMQFRVVPVMDDASFIRSINRWGRLKDKYPGWTFALGSRAQQATASQNYAGVTSWQQAKTIASALFAHGGIVTGRTAFPNPMPITLPKDDAILPKKIVLGDTHVDYSRATERVKRWLEDGRVR